MAKAARAQAKKANFVKIAQKRTTKAIKSISLLENLANRGSFTDHQVEKMVGALYAACDAVNKKFLVVAETKQASDFEFGSDDE